MKIPERIKPKSKSAVVNYVILLLVVAEFILTLVPSIHFVAADRKFDAETKKPVITKVEVNTSLQNYLWFPASGNDKLNDKLTEQLAEDHFKDAEMTDPEKNSFINATTVFPILSAIISIVFLIVCIAFGGNLAATVIAVLWGVSGCLACFVKNDLFRLQSTYIVQMILIILATLLAIANAVVTFMPKAQKGSNENKETA